MCTPTPHPKRGRRVPILHALVILRCHVSSALHSYFFVAKPRAMDRAGSLRLGLHGWRRHGHSPEWHCGHMIADFGQLVLHDWAPWAQCGQTPMGSNFHCTGRGLHTLNVEEAWHERGWAGTCNSRGHSTISRYISRSFIMAVWILWCCSRHLQGGCTVFGMPVGRWQTWMNHLDCGIIGFPCQRRSRSPVIALSVMCKPGWCWDDLVQRHGLHTLVVEEATVGLARLCLDGSVHLDVHMLGLQFLPLHWQLGLPGKLGC